MALFPRPLIFFLWMMALMSIAQWVGTTLKPEVTYGDMAAILSPVFVSVLFGMCVLGARWWKNNHPFIARFCDQEYDAPLEQTSNRPYRRTKVIGVGDVKLTIAVRTKTATTANPFELRFVEKTFWGRWTNVDQEII